MENFSAMKFKMPFSLQHYPNKSLLYNKVKLFHLIVEHNAVYTPPNMHTKEKKQSMQKQYPTFPQ